MSKRRVVITGTGLVTPLGIGAEANRDALLRGDSGVGPITRFDASGIPVRIGGEVKGFSPKTYIPDRKVRKLLKRGFQLGEAATAIAFVGSGLEPDAVAPERLGVYTGSDQEIDRIMHYFARGVERSLDDAGRIAPDRFATDGIDAVDPLWLIKELPNAVLCYTSIKLRAMGPNNNFVTGGVASAQAIGEAFRQIRHGAADVVVACGYESPLSKEVFLDYNGLGLLSRRNLDRDGAVFSEGAGALVLEEHDRARARGATILAELVGYGTTTGTHALIAPRPDGLDVAGAIRTALDDACMAPEAIGAVNAHGSATRANDATEARGIVEALGDHGRSVPVYATKSMTGHMMAATGAAEAIFGILAMAAGTIPATRNYSKPDPECPLNVVHGEPLSEPVEAFLSLSRSLGGQNCALLFRRAPGG